MSQNKTNPWTWIPSLYLAEGLPYVAVMTISVILYKRMGISNADIALYTSWLYLPWVIKPLWSPFVDILKTKRWWIVTMQLLIGAGFGGIALMIPVPSFFQATLAFFWLMAFSSATHDIAADGFYMLGLDTNQQAAYVGIRSTFYRVATIMGQGVLIILAGFLETTTGREPINITVNTSPQYEQSVLQINDSLSFTELEGELRFVTDLATVQISTQTRDKDAVKLFIEKIQSVNHDNGFTLREEETKEKTARAWISFFSEHVSKPLGKWIKKNFGEKRNVATELSDKAGNVAVVPVRLSKKPDAGKEIMLNTTRYRGDESISLIQGEHLVFNETNWNKAAYLLFQLDPKLNADSSASYRGLSGNIPMAWSITFFVLAGLFLLFSLYHKFALPRPEIDHHSTLTATNILREFGVTFASFFRKPQIFSALFFMLTFRFSEAQLLKLINPFLLDSLDKGGLGLTTGTVGFVYGTVGIIGLTLGGIIGGVAASRGGLRKWLWPMTLSMLLTSITFLYLSFTQSDNLLIINICVFIEQFGYGFGFTAYMLYLIYFSEGEHKTAHYAICTGFMALGMMIPGMFAGWLQEQLGYNHFFIWVMSCSVVPIIAVSLLKINPDYGKAKKNERQ